MVNTSMDLDQPRRDSTPTDNPFGDQNSKQVPVLECQHFSIRFVANIRKRDPKLCDPFSSYVSRDGSTYIKHKLPPMELPKFRWSQCDSSAAPRPRSSGGTSKEAQKPTVEMEDAPIPLIEKPSKAVYAPKIRSTEASPTYSKDNKNCNNPSTISANTKGKGKAHVENELALQTGFENGPVKESSSQRIMQRITNGKDASRYVDDEVDVRARSVGNKKPTKSHHHKNRKSAGIVKGSRRKRMNRDKGYNANEISLMNKQASLEAQHSGAWTNRLRTEVAGILHGSSSGSSSGTKARRVPLPDLNELNVQPSQDDDNNVLVAGNNHLVENDYDYLGVDRGKTPKVRLMSELLGLKENPDAKLKLKNPSPSGPKSTSSDLSTQSPMNKNNGKRKKVSFDRVEESNSLEIKGLNSGTKKPKTPRFVVTSESESEDEVTEITSKAFAKILGRSSLGKKPLHEKRNDKKVRVDHGASSHDLNEGNIHPVQDGFYVWPSSSEPVIRDGGYAFKTTPGVAPFTRNRYDGSTAPKSNSKGKGVWIPEAEEGGDQSQNSAMQGRIQEININSIPTTIAGDDRGQTNFPSWQRPHQDPYSITGQECVYSRSSSTVGLLAPNNNSSNAHINFRSHFPSYLHAVDFYNNRHRGFPPRPNMDPRGWPSVAGPSRMPLGITNPAMIWQSSIVLNRGTLGPSTLNINHGNLSFSSGRAYNAGEQPRAMPGGRDRESRERNSKHLA